MFQSLSVLKLGDPNMAGLVVVRKSGDPFGTGLLAGWVDCVQF